ncbi:potassium channel family protein [Erythrobacter sp. JK5]|uniref:potassium channel family protein n=1 Tax=Erythrobacter sp. JK5 TaxID=2829500 RepID=UPI001BA9D50B|nr:potassium channel family protein [Erythrobacter sp. JK5]QUL37963.1 two pore domain potassium channel family protein [Erythrobacter sp. JK5]
MHQVIAGIAISAVLVAASLYLHFSVLRAMSGHFARAKTAIKRPMMTVMTVIFFTHLVEITLFAAAFNIMGHVGLGKLSGAYNSTAVDYFYFSIATYSTLGIGDIAPDGAMRMVAGVEALAGLLLIAWSASFTYLMMERLWASGEDRE